MPKSWFQVKTSAAARAASTPPGRCWISASSCIIAPSFADIFYNNTFKNGILPVKLSEERVNELLRFLLELPGAEITVDLEAQTVTGPDGKVDTFEMDPFRKHCLLNGLDDIGLTLQKEASITAYEQKTQTTRPWA